MNQVRFVLYCTAAVALLSIATFKLLDANVAQAQSSSAACSATPCHMINLFDPDLADLKYLNNQALNDAVNAAAEGVKNSTGKDLSCYPSPVTLTVFTRSDPADPKLETLIASTRMGVLVTYFDGHGVPWQSIDPVYAPASGSNGPGSDGTVDMTLNNVDRDPPILKTNSTPPKGTKVKAGDQIKVHATASERHADGHKSYPTGVKSIQLTANGLLVEPAEDYGIKPPPCQVRTFERTYTVPANPPPVVHLRVIAEDAVGHQTFEKADFPTADWHGVLKVKGKGNVYDEEGELTFAFSEAPDGTLKGSAHFRRTANRPKPFGRCTFTRNYSADEIDLPITGNRDGDQFVLDTNTRTATATVTYGGGCPGGGRAVPTNVLAAFSAVAAHPRVRAEDGATSTYHYETPGGRADGLVSEGSIELHQAKP